jgi:hypothetical protein
VFLALNLRSSAGFVRAVVGCGSVTAATQYSLRFFRTIVAVFPLCVLFPPRNLYSFEELQNAAIKTRLYAR